MQHVAEQRQAALLQKFQEQVRAGLRAQTLPNGLPAEALLLRVTATAHEISASCYGGASAETWAVAFAAT